MTGSGLRLSTHNLHFGLEPVGSTSGTRTVTLTNPGTKAVTLGAIAASGDFAVAGGSCAPTGSLAATSSCTIAVDFTPTSAGRRAGTLKVTAAGASAPSTVTRQGEGTSAETPSASLSNDAITFASVAVGQTSGSQALTLSMARGSEPLALSGLSVLGSGRDDYKLSSNCGTTLQSGAACVINVSYEPKSSCKGDALLWVASNAHGAVAAELQGTATGTAATSHAGSGVAAATATVVASTPELVFDPVAIGATSGSLEAILANTSSSPVRLGAVQVGGGDFEVVADECGNSTLAAGATCSIKVAFAPRTAGAQSGVLTATVAGAAGPTVRLDSAAFAPTAAASLPMSTTTASQSGGGGAIGPWPLLASAVALLLRRRERRGAR